MYALRPDFQGAALFAVLALLAGCATDAPLRDGSSSLRSSQSPQSLQANNRVGFGRVEAVRDVNIQDTRPLPKKYSAVGEGAPPSLAQATTGMPSPRQKRMELQVRLDNGEGVTVVQAAEIAFRPGDRVRVMQGHDGSRRVIY